MNTSVTDLSSSDKAGISKRHDAAQSIVHGAAELALGLFKDRDSLDIEVKGLQDWVSNADKSVEDTIRAALVSAFPDDGIVGEEHGDVNGTSGFIWVIDPIDGTTNFVNGMPGWCVVLACVLDDHTVSAVIRDPVVGETFEATRGCGATLNGKSIRVSAVDSLDQGTLGVGHSTRVPAGQTLRLLTLLLEQNGLFRRSGSGALDLACVAAGRLIGYVEPHMNAWDCIAAILLVEEAGGVVEPFDMSTMIASGGCVIVASPGVYEQVQGMADDAFKV